MKYRELWLRLAPLYGEGEARALADYVLEERFGMSKADALCGRLDELGDEENADMQRILARMEKGEPVQYVLGEAIFCGRAFRVSTATLIPRPETEELCAFIKEECGGCGAPRVLDIGTGSGCIAITLALDLPHSSVSACDISTAALAVARENAVRLNAEVEFMQTDILHARPVPGRWNVIVSNPPYICMKEKKDMSANVLDHEPHTALFVPDDDPLLFYRAITRYAARSLAPGGRLFFEINPLYADGTEAMMAAEGFAGVTVRRDEYGKRRMAMGTVSVP